MIYDSASNTIGRATSMWLAVDKSTRRPIRPQKFDDVSSVVSMDRKVLFDEPLIAEIRIEDTNTTEQNTSLNMPITVRSIATFM